MMTNKEYLTKSLAGLDISDDDIDVILLKAGLSGTAATDANACDIAVYNRMSTVLKSMMRNVSEGGYSNSWNMEAVKLFYKSLCYELGKENVLLKRPTLRNRSNYW